MIKMKKIILIIFSLLIMTAISFGAQKTLTTYTWDGNLNINVSSPDDVNKFELSFGNGDDPENQFTTLSGQWRVQDGYLTVGTGDSRLIFEHGEGNDYRISVNATVPMFLLQQPGFGIYYRVTGTTNINGYCFEYAPRQTGSGIDFNVRKIVNGNHNQAPFQTLYRTTSQFRDIYNKSHQISITVQGNRHIIKIDGQEIMNFVDNDYLTGKTGLRTRDAIGIYTPNFHHVLIHAIPPLKTGEVVWWSFEEGDGDVAYGSGFVNGIEENNGRMSSGIERNNSGIYGSAIQSRGSASITVDHASVLNQDNQFTIEAWVRPSNNNQTAQMVFKGVVGNRGHGLYQNNNNSPESGGWNAQVYTTSGVVRLCWGERRPSVNQWYHLVLSVSGSSATFYVNGQLKASENLSGTIVWNTDDLIIGQNFQGTIDEVFYYKRALTAADVSSRFNKYKDNMQ